MFEKYASILLKISQIIRLKNSQAILMRRFIRKAIIKSQVLIKYFQVPEPQFCMAKGNKQEAKGPRKKIQNNQKKKSKSVENQSNTNDNQRNLESPSPSNFRLQSTINAINTAEKLRKEANSSNSSIMKSYYDAFGLSILQIIKTLYSGLEPTEILEFIDFQYGRFLEILLLMLQDELPIVSLDMNMINYSNSSINQEIPRSFSFGMRKFREKRNITDPNTSIDLDEIDIKCLCVSQLLLMGVGEISPKMKSKDKGQTTEHHFHRIVTHLLGKNKLLTPKLFYLIEKNWRKIMSIMQNQIQQDEKESQVQGFEEQKRENERIPISNNEAQRGGDMQSEEKRQKKTGIKQSTNGPHNFMSHQDSSMISFGEEDLSSYLVDLTNNDPDESKRFQNDKLKDRLTEEQRQRMLFGNDEEEMQQNEGKTQNYGGKAAKFIDNKIRIGQQCENYQANQIAKYQYNFQKFFTVDRNTKSKKIRKQSQKKVKNDQEKRLMTKNGEKTKQEEISQQYVAKNPQQLVMDEDEFFMQDEEVNLEGREGMCYDNSSMEEIINQQFEEEQSQIMRSETMQSSERINLEFQMIQLQSPQMPQASIVEATVQNEVNPNRAVRHVHRQIDYLVSLALSNREEFIESIASHIYFELMVWNGRLMREKPQKKGK